MVAETRFGPAPGRRVVLAKPSSYMNESGGPVTAVAGYFGIDPAGLVVVHDELDVPFGTIRLKFGGGEGGHNGLRSISGSLKTRGFTEDAGLLPGPGRGGPATGPGGRRRLCAVRVFRGRAQTIAGRAGRCRRCGGGPGHPGSHRRPAALARTPLTTLLSLLADCRAQTAQDPRRPGAHFAPIDPYGAARGRTAPACRYQTYPNGAIAAEMAGSASQRHTPRGPGPAGVWYLAEVGDLPGPRTKPPGGQNGAR